ncbi:unnamed protein product [Rotaria socialis]|uniref:N-acetylgalactosaminide beta-1,3-galactosyltransferase n=1 Tax=Rotaria socialis TaxID=392032 RepID=A0A821BMJ8_9BILA|nr:unnamed protein product [Rotaria socialis]
MEFNSNDLPNLKCFSLQYESLTDEYDNQVVPLLRRMRNLEDLTLYIQIHKRNRLVDVDKYRSRLFCFVLTNEENLETRGRAAYETWRNRCGRFVFVTRLNSSKHSEKENHFLEKFRSIIEHIPTLPDEHYSHLTDKVYASLLYFYKNHPDYDWCLKADDDTYIIVENLLRFLASTIKRYPKPVLYGYRFREDYYASGGAGYVSTRQGLELFASYYINKNSTYSQCTVIMEDMMVGKCLKKAFELAPTQIAKHLTLVGETIDQQGRERFHPFNFPVHFNGPSNTTKREWIYFRPFHHNIFDYEAFSETTISFHHTQPNDDMYQIHSLIYDIRQFDKQVCLSHL